MDGLDGWCNFGFRYLEKIVDKKSPEYMTALYALRVLTERRVAEMKWSRSRP